MKPLSKRFDSKKIFLTVLFFGFSLFLLLNHNLFSRPAQVWEPEAAGPETRPAPAESRHGEPSMRLFKTDATGEYDAEVWVNPGEAGKIYMKAKWVKKRRYVIHGLEFETTAQAAWAPDPAELLPYKAHMNLGAGESGAAPARFEVWFTPDSGGKRRKLYEKVFNVEHSYGRGKWIY